MFLKTSRYAQVPRFEPDPDGRADFKGVRARAIARAPGVLEHTLGADDRPDQLAGEYYGADRAWWRILDANPEFLIAGPLYAADGTRVAGWPGPAPDAGTGDVMVSDRMQGDAVLIPKRRE